MHKISFLRAEQIFCETFSMISTPRDFHNMLDKALSNLVYLCTHAAAYCVLQRAGKPAP